MPSTPVKHLADLRSRADSQWYSSIYEDQRPKIEDTERSDDRNTSRTNLTGLKPAEHFSFFFFLSSFPPEFLLPFCPSFFFLFLLPSILYLFYSFFLPSFIYSDVLIFFKKFLLILPPIFLYSYSLPSFHFLFPFSFLPVSFFFRLLSPFPTGETIKARALKRPELDPVRPINVSSRPVSTGD